MKTAAYSSSCGLHILRLHARSQSKHLLLNVRPCSSTVEVPTTLPGSTTSTHLHSAGNKKQPLQLSLGPLPLVEQRFRVSRRRYQPPSSSPPGSARNGGSVPAASGKQQQQQEQHQQQSKYHPEEFVLLAPDDVDEVIDLYFERGHMDADPYWVRAWPSALALASTVLDSPELVRGKRVADLGAGLGVAGIAAALAGAREVVLLDREHLALQCGLASASATLRGGAKVEGLQVGSPLSGSSSSSSSSSADSSGSLTGSIADGDEIGGQPPKPDQEVDKAAARHNHWAHLPLPSFWFHGPDLQRAIPNAANLAAVNEEHAGQAGSHGLAHPSGADDLGVCEEQRQGHQTGGAVDGNGQCRSNGVKRAGRAADHDSVGSDGNSSSDSEAQDGGSSSSSSCGYTSRNGSSGSGSSSSSLGRDVNIAGLSGSGQKSQTPHVWSFPLDWSDHEQVELLAQRCNSSSSSSSFGGSRGGGNAVSGSSRVSSGRGAGIFEGNSSRGRRSSTAPPFDVVLACDVLYEARAVQPIARIIPKLLRPQDGVLLLADPPNRTVANRERFMHLVAGGRGDEDDTETDGLQLTVKEQWIAPCHIDDLDNEMVGGLSAQGADQAPVQLHVMKCKGVGEDTVGLKL